MTALLTIRSRGDFAQIVVAREGDFPEVVWSRVLSEWGTEGPDPAARIYVPVERFLSQLVWLAEACRRHKVGIRWDDQVVAMVRAGQAERRALDRLATDHGPLGSEEAEQRLAGGRFVRALRDFQKRDLGKLLALPNGANFSVPGAGKTAVTYALYEAERLAGRVERLLVVAPLSAFEAWMTESAECFGEPPVLHRYDGDGLPARTEVCLVNYQRLSASYEQIAGWMAERPCHVVLDEAHRMKRGWGRMGPVGAEPCLSCGAPRRPDRDACTAGHARC